MAIVVPSRFSLLKIVEDDYLPPKPKESTKSKKVENKNKKTEEKKVKTTKNNKQNNKNGMKKKSVSSTNVEHEEKAKFIDPNDAKFEEDLQQALMLSKLEIEKQILDDDFETNNMQFQLQNSNKKQKKKSINTTETTLLALDSLNGMSNVNSNEIQHLEYRKSKKHGKTEIDSNKNHSNCTKRAPPSNEEIKGSQLQVILDSKEKEISDLKLEIGNLKAELLRVKSRNKQLCNIIGQGEMQDKAQVLVEVERLRDIQSELTKEVASLHAQLEQERSKGSASKIDPKNKDKKKRTPSEREM